MGRGCLCLLLLEKPHRRNHASKSTHVPLMRLARLGRTGTSNHSCHQSLCHEPEGCVYKTCSSRAFSFLQRKRLVLFPKDIKNDRMCTLSCAFDCIIKKLSELAHSRHQPYFKSLSCLCYGVSGFAAPQNDN
jgi:hypothetical protein